jgi:HSP20 family molecular chaperone IbpA
MTIVHDGIRQRAFQLFEEKGCQPGFELEDWLEAERQVLFCPPAELIETRNEVHIIAAVPGFEARALQVDVFPESITIEGKRPATEPAPGAHFSELGEKRLLRQFALPARICPDDVEATLDDGVLRIIVKKEAAAVSPAAVEMKNSRRAAA